MKKLCLLLLSIMVLHLNGAIQPTIGTTELMKANGGVGTNIGLRANTIFGTGGNGSTLWSNNVTASNLAAGAVGRTPTVTFDWLNGGFTNSGGASFSGGNLSLATDGSVISLGGNFTIADGSKFKSASRGGLLVGASDGLHGLVDDAGTSVKGLYYGGFTAAYPGTHRASANNGNLMITDGIGTLTKRGATNGLIVQGQVRSRNVFTAFLGDSIPWLTWSNVFMKDYPWLLRGDYTNAAVSGEESFQTAQDYTNYVSVLKRQSHEQEFWLPVATGINDINRGSNASVVITNLIQIWSAATNDGWQLVASTIGNVNAWTSGGPSNLQQIAVNGWIRTNFLKWTTHLMEPDRMFQSMADTVISYDGVHPTDYARVKFAQHLSQVMRRDDGLRTIISTNADTYLVGTPAPAKLIFGVNDKTNIVLNTDGTVSIGSNAAEFQFITSNLLSGQTYTNLTQRGHVSATISMTNVLAGDVSAMSLIVDNNADGTWDFTNGPVRINGVALSAGSEQLFGLLQPGARFAFTNQNAGITPSAEIITGSCQWSRW